MFKRKVETMSVKEFMARKEPVVNFPPLGNLVRQAHEIKLLPKLQFDNRKLAFGNSETGEPRFPIKPIVKACVTAGVIVLSLTFGDVSLAAAGTIDGAVTAKVVNAFAPLVELVKALSYPISLVMMLGGGLFVMIGNSERGFGMIQKAGLGYVLVQMLPMLMDLLVEIAKSL
jgi:hypothetical protein